MAEPKEGKSFFRKMVQFVANPATDWSDVASRQEDARDTELDKSELKAMIERKRRNDFVRKREFDTLRRLRREGLSPEQLAALGGSSRIDDGDARSSESGLRQDVRVKAKIDEIEKQMVGDGARSPAARRTTGFGAGPTEAQAFQPDPASRRSVLPDAFRSVGGPDDDGPLPALPPLPEFDAPSTPMSAPAMMGGGLAPLRPVNSEPPVEAAPPRLQKPVFGHTNAAAIEVSEVVHDPELDEAVIAFANADFGHCEHALTQLLLPNAQRADHSETWLVLFDLYRAIGQQAKFESLALDYVNRFGSSSPQWFSLPRLVAEAVAAEERPSTVRASTDVGWIAPERLDVEAVARLRSVTLQLPLPWVLDWAAVRHVDAEAASQLTALMRQWAGQKVEMRWLGGDVLLGVLQEAAPTAVRDADPAYWMARLEALRLANRPDQFDEAAIDYCVTYEVSPPSWERADCIARISGSTSVTTTPPPPSVVTEVTTGFFESSLQDDALVGQQIAHVELSGQLVGDISATLARLDQQVNAAHLVTVSCARLIRVDFLAAGDLLNWVLGKRNQQRSVTFSEAHRLVALFFGAMGINEHARVQVRRD